MKLRNFPHLSFLALIAASALFTAASADDRFSAEGELSNDLFFSADLDSGKTADTYRWKQNQIQLNWQISEHVRAAIRTQLEQDWRVNGKTQITPTQIEDLLKEAWIEVRDVGGQPIAFVFGIQEVAWGQDLHKMPIFQNSPIHEDLADADQGQVVGVTVSLDKNIFNLIDGAEITAFESDGKFLEIGKMDGLSVRLHRELFDKIQVEVSYLHKGNTYDSSLKPENRTSVGLIFQSGDWTAWAEGVQFRGNQRYGNGVSATVGASRQVTKNGEIVVEASWIEHSLEEVGIGYNLKFRKGWSIGPEIRVRSYRFGFDPKEGEPEVSGKNDAIFGVRLKYKFGPTNP